MTEAEFNRLLDIAQRRPLTPAEEVRVREYTLERPEARNLWEEEAALNHVLSRLPQAPLSSNFTAQVLHAVGREQDGALTSATVAGWSRLWRWRPLAAATVGAAA